jgi:4-carboxymuconolactone decarboxylase
MTGEPRVALRGSVADDARLAAIYDRVAKSVGAVPTMYQVLGNSPEILDGWIGLGWGLRSASAADRGLLELVIMRVAQLSGSEYVWRSHWRLALKSGMDEVKLHALGRWSERDLFTDSERAVLALADALTQDVGVPDDVWSGVAARFDDQQRVVLVMTISWYCCVARVAAGLQVPLEKQHVRIPGLGAAP